MKLEHKKQDTNLLRGLCQATAITMKVFIGTVCVTNELVYMLKFSITCKFTFKTDTITKVYNEYTCGVDYVATEPVLEDYERVVLL